jgi:hypothetical protein
MMLLDKNLLIIENGYRGPSSMNVNVHEHKAPTDDSIKLFEELKGKAYVSIIETIKMQNNILSMNYIFYKNFGYSFDYILKYKFQLNGENYSGDIKFDEYEVRDLNTNKRIELVFQRIANQITGLLISSMKPLDRRELFGI